MKVSNREFEQRRDHVRPISLFKVQEASQVIIILIINYRSTPVQPRVVVNGEIIGCVFGSQTAERKHVERHEQNVFVPLLNHHELHCVQHANGEKQDEADLGKGGARNESGPLGSVEVICRDYRKAPNLLLTHNFKLILITL